MGNTDTKLAFRKAVVQLTTKKTALEAGDDAFWAQFWTDPNVTVSDIFTLIPATEIRSLRDENPSNLATLLYKCVERIVNARATCCTGPQEHIIVLNCVHILTRVIPYIFEDPDWRGFFWSTVPGEVADLDHAGGLTGREMNTDSSPPMAQSLLNALADLLFCPDFTVNATKRIGPENPEDLSTIDSCEYIWEAGVGFSTSPPHNLQFDVNRVAILKLLLTCFSESMYLPPTPENQALPNKWLAHFSSSENRHALPLFTSLLNTVCSYDPVGYGVPYNHLMFNDTREPLAEVASQLLVVLLDQNSEQTPTPVTENSSEEGVLEQTPELGAQENLFCNYLSRIHREEDFHFILHGLAQLLNNPLIQTYLPNSTKKINFHQELLVLFWKMCDLNKKFLFFVLKSSDVLEILVPILYHLNDARSDQSRLGLMHIGVFILLLLSGERNFGVRLNKPYSVRIPMDIPVFTGTHADLLVIVFHKIITTGHQRLQPLYDCLLTIIVNVSPYLKSLSMVTSNKLLHLLEAFSTPWFLFSGASNHHLVFFLLEIFNNIIQYQFDGNSHLIYAIIRKRNMFHQLANLSTDPSTARRPRRRRKGSESSSEEEDKPLTDQLPEIEAQVEEVHRSGVDADSSDSDGGSAVTSSHQSTTSKDTSYRKVIGRSHSVSSTGSFVATSDWIQSWKQKLPLQTIMRMLQVLVPQVEKICIDKGLTDESEILKFLQHGTLVGLLPVPHPILIRKYQANSGTQMWFRTYMWGIVYLRNIDPPIWYDTDVKLFEIQRV